MSKINLRHLVEPTRASTLIKCRRCMGFILALYLMCYILKFLLVQTNLLNDV